MRGKPAEQVKPAHSPQNQGGERNFAKLAAQNHLVRSEPPFAMPHSIDEVLHNQRSSGAGIHAHNPGHPEGFEQQAQEEAAAAAASQPSVELAVEQLDPGLAGDDKKEAAAEPRGKLGVAVPCYGPASQKESICSDRGSDRASKMK